MILRDVLRALAQMGDAAFRKVLLQGVGLTLALFLAVYAGFVWLMQWVVPDTLALPWVGQVGWIDVAASGASVLVLLVASVFLMVPTASAVTGFFLDDVTDAVEAKHYPALAPARRLGTLETVRDVLGFFGTIVVANLAALVLYLLFAPAAPLIFLAMNGYLLGREYFQMIAMRRLGRDGAAAMRRRHGGQIWLAGVLMAVPLTVPVLNLLVPILGVATFTHLFHRVAPASGRTSRYRAP